MFSFFMNKINFYFCDLFIVMMLRNQDLPPPPNKSVGRGFDAETGSSRGSGRGRQIFWFGDAVRTVMLINTKKRWVNTYKKSLYVWCWFVMFASESSHASSFKKFLDLRVPKNPTPRRSALLEYMHWALMQPNLKKKKKRKKLKNTYCK